MAAIESKEPKPVLTDRVTKGGRRLWYRLTVLQQPERARACGSGSKSANDRRPVDPPPVVELRVFEGPSIDTAKDITFHHNASFFLFVTLEHSRLIAHGRVPQGHNETQPPVLTGSPVSGMAYLDRPTEAGYFLFPDLSVRHEGNYRLVFQLYEQPKEKADYDIDQDDSQDSDEGPFCHRADIKSNEFSVYSAKKFPGLAESTSLSRMVAEQGCRVRIRRDVRMRRRDGKPGGDFDKSAEDEAARYRRASATPEVQSQYYRARSGSAASDHRSPYAGDAQRRSSGSEGYPGAPPPFAANPPPPYVANPPGPVSNLRFGDEPAPQFSPHYPPPHAAQPPPVSPTTSYHSQHQSPYPPAPQLSNQYAPPPPRPVSQSMTASSPVKADAPERRISGTYAPPSPAHPMASDAQRPSIPPMQSPSYPPPSAPSHSMQQAPPSYPPPPPLNRPRTPATSQGTTLPSLASMLHNPPPPLMPSSQKLEAEIPAAEPRTGNKRGYDDTFYYNPRPLFNGSRPLDPHHSDGRHQDAAPGTPLWYKRADGSWGQKPEAQYID